MHSVDVAGYIASALVFSAFYMKDMVPLRILAICSNVAFLIYGTSMLLTPVIVLHALLLPLNVWRLIAAIERRRLSADALKQ
jgi:CRP/FNR family cyclic AMP-dependent transcriptional regulator